MLPTHHSAHRRRTRLGATLLVLLGLKAAQATVVPAGIIATSTTWSLAGSPYVVQGTVSVYGAALPRLTIEAGVEVRFLAGASLVVGSNSSNWNDYRGQLTALGTAAQPILFTADNGLSGGWNGITFGNNADYNGATSSFQYCVVEKATVNLALNSSAQPALLDHVESRLASQRGLELEGYSTAISLQDLSLHHNGGAGLQLQGAPLPATVNLSMTDNGENRVEYTGTIAGDLSLDLPAWPHPVVFTGTTLVMGANPRLTLVPGSTLRFKSGASFQVAGNSGNWNDYRGQLTALGTAAQPILFTADNGLSGGWNGITFGNNADYNGATSSVQYCVVEKATVNLALSSSAQPALLDHVESRLASQRGLELEGYSTAISLQDLSLHHNGGAGLQLQGAPLPVTVNLSMTDNGENRVEYTGTIAGDLSLDLPAWPHPVVFTGTTLVMGANPRLTLVPGSTLRFKSGASFQVAGNSGNWNDYRGQLTALGTAAQPILFTADNGLSGGWNGITFGNNADYNGATSSFQHCVVERATVNLALSSTNQPDTLRYISLAGGSQRGLQLSSAYPVVANCHLLDNEVGIHASNGATTIVGDSPSLSNTFLGNGSWNMYNNGSGPILARYNGWCLEDGSSPADGIYDQVDNPAKGLVTWSPTSPVEVLRLSSTYDPSTRTLWLEWCPVAGASLYHVYQSTGGWPNPGNATRILSTTESLVAIAVPDGNARACYSVTWEGTARSGCR